MRQYALVPIPCGSAGLVATARGLSNLILMRRRGRHAHALLHRRFPDATPNPRLLPELQGQLRDYFAGRRISFRVALDLSSLTPFQRQVLGACRKIGYGETMTYGQLARHIDKPSAARAVGGALARNPIPLVIPCHRVVAGDGSLGGFSAEQGVSLKRWLLELESHSGKKR